MSGVWVFRNGVLRLVSNPHLEPIDGSDQLAATRRPVLVHIPTGEVISSYESLEKKLTSIGWERYYDDPEMLQFHKASSIHLITLPKDFSRFKSIHMYDIVVKNRGYFVVKEI